MLVRVAIRVILNRLGDMQMLVAPQSICALTGSMLQHIFLQRNSRVVSTESVLSMPH
jgi:hypothetical protein